MLVIVGRAQDCCVLTGKRNVAGLYSRAFIETENRRFLSFLEGFRIPWRDGRSLTLSALSIFDHKGADKRRVLRMPLSRSVECSCYPARVIIPSETAARGGLTLERRDNAAYGRQMDGSAYMKPLNTVGGLSRWLRIGSNTRYRTPDVVNFLVLTFFLFLYWGGVSSMCSFVTECWSQLANSYCSAPQVVVMAGRHQRDFI